MESRFANLRGVRWRIDLGILPSCASIDDLRRVTADTRRRYASLRRRLLVDPHLPKDGSGSPNLVVDNPLSQNPESTWGRFFQNAELERMLDKDLSRLYPEHGTYFQTPACQAMLRRILLLWCLRHPEYGYRQGMHELLAPLLYVLHIDIQHLSEVRSLYEDYFNDDFDKLLYPDSDLVSNYRFTKAKNWATGTDENSNSDQNAAKFNSLDDLDPETRYIFLLTDAYGAEGELGIVLSERFMEHDAYCLFENLMNGTRGVVAMADFFSPSPAYGSSSGLSPVLEASSSLYHLLSVVDPSLHSHLVEISVEPQYFALRWLRVLFGREFSLKDLLVIWDEIFASPNGNVVEDNMDYSFRVLCSSRGAFIAGIAVSILLYLRSSLLATEHTTICLQRLLNFPENVNVKKLIEKARSLQDIALKSNVSSSEVHEDSYKNKSAVQRVYSLPPASVCPQTPLTKSNESYWEEKWRMLNSGEAEKKENDSRLASCKILKRPLGDSFNLSRTESDPSPVNALHGSTGGCPPIRRSLLNDLTRAEANNLGQDTSSTISILDDKAVSLSVDGEKHRAQEADKNVMGRISDVTGTACASCDNSTLSSATIPQSMENGSENDSEKSSITLNASLADNDNDNEIDCTEDSGTSSNISENPESSTSKETTTTNKPGMNTEELEKAAIKERKPLFQWLWKLSRGSGEASSSKVSMAADTKKYTSSSFDSSAVNGKPEVADRKVVGTLKNLGQSMLDNIQVIESVFQQDWSQTGSLDNILGTKGQATAVTALKELRKISNILSEM